MSELEASNRHRLHHLLWECFVGMTPVIEEAFTGTELSLALAGTLDEIGTTPGVTVAEISRRTPKTQQAISQAAAKLEKLGLVERRLGSGRGVELYLTPTGEDARADGVAREEKIDVRLADLLGTQEFEALLDALERASVRFHPREVAHPTKASSS